MPLKNATAAGTMTLTAAEVRRCRARRASIAWTRVGRLATRPGPAGHMREACGHDVQASAPAGVPTAKRHPICEAPRAPDQRRGCEPFQTRPARLGARQYAPPAEQSQGHRPPRPQAGDPNPPEHRMAEGRQHSGMGLPQLPDVTVIWGGAGARPVHHRLSAALGRRSPSRRCAGEVGGASGEVAADIVLFLFYFRPSSATLPQCPAAIAETLTA